MADFPDRRPYAATSNVLAVLNRARSRNLPDVIGNDFLRIAGIPENVFGRVAEAIRFLGLVNDDLSPSDLLKAIAAAPDESYRELLAGALRAAYRVDFDAIDPAKDTQAQVAGQFQRYQPRSQTARMVMLFLGLAREAGIPIRDAPRDRQMRSQQSAGPMHTPRTGGGRSRASGQSKGPRRQAPPPPFSGGGGLFGLTEADVAKLSEEEFADVWNALGKIARAKLRPTVSEPDSDEDTDADAEADE